MLLESRERVEVAHDLDIVSTHDDGERDEHGPEGALAIDLEGLPGGQLVLSRGTSLGHISIDLIELAWDRLGRCLLVQVGVGRGMLDHGARFFFSPSWLG